jgi:hypothetical protein
MTRRPFPLILAAGLALTVGALLAGCASGGGTAPSAGSPSASEASAEITAAWLDGGTMVGVVTWGSSTCRPVVADASYDAGSLNVTFAEPAADAACTLDLVPRATPVSLPASVDGSDDLHIAVTGGGFAGDTVLAGATGLVPGDGVMTGTPSAGWTGTAGTLVLLTWGSSGCPPVIADAAVSAPGQITVTEAQPAADRVCTADMGPRATVVEVPGTEAGATYEVILLTDGGGSFEVPVAGVAP